MQTFARNPVWMPGIALVAASAVAIAPITPLPTPSLPDVAVSAPHARSVELPVQLSASVADLLTLPIIRQWILNRIDDIVTLGAGLAASGVVIGQELVALPGKLVLFTQQIFSNPQEALNTLIYDLIVNPLVRIAAPTLWAIIERRERNLEVAHNYQEAVPTAVLGFIGWSATAIDDVLTSWIDGGQIITASLFDGQIGNVLPAIGQAIDRVIQGFSTGAQDLVEGTYLVQYEIATALGRILPVAPKPPPSPPLLPNWPPAPAAALSAPASGLAAVDIPNLKGSATTFALETTTKPPITGAEVGADVQDSTGTEVGADKAGAGAEVDADKLGAGAELGVGKLGAGKLGVGKAGAGKLGVGKAGAGKLGVGKAGAGKSGADT